MAYFDYSTTATALLQSRMGVVTFGNSAVQSVGLTTYSTSATANSQLLTAVNSLAYLDSTGTDIIGSVVENYLNDRRNCKYIANMLSF